MLDLIKRLFKCRTKTKDPDPDPETGQGQNIPNQALIFMPEMNEFNNQTFQEHQKHLTEDFEPQTIIEDEESPAVTITLRPPLRNDDLLIHVVTPKAPVIYHYPNKTEEKIHTNKDFIKHIQQNLKSQYSQRHDKYPYLPKSNKLNNYHPPTPRPAPREDDNYPPTPSPALGENDDHLPTPRPTLGEFEEVRDIFSNSNRRGIPNFIRNRSSTQLNFF